MWLPASSFPKVMVSAHPTTTQPLGFQTAAFMGSLTCLEDLISDGEACSVGLIVRHELDEELVSRGDDRRGGNLPAVLPHQLTTLVHTIPHLHIVVPEQDKKDGGRVSCAAFLNHVIF